MPLLIPLGEKYELLRSHNNLQNVNVEIVPNVMIIHIISNK